MADDIIKTNNISQQQATTRDSAEAKQFRDTQKAIDAQTKSIQANTKAYENFGRTRSRFEQQERTFLQQINESNRAFEEQIRTVGKLKYTYGELFGAMGRISQTMSRFAPLSRTYNMMLDQMRSGQESFTKSLLLSSDTLSTASTTSQKYINTMETSFRNARKLAGEFRIDAEAMRTATKELVGSFSSQIGATKDMESTTTSLQRSMVIYSRYLGTSMQDVTKAWQERMESTNMTLKETQSEMALVGREIDNYIKNLKKLGNRVLQTANIGKREFLAMIQETGQAFRTGIFDASAYAKVLAKIIPESKKALMTKTEIKDMQKALGSFLSEASKFQGQAGVYGVMAVDKLIDKAMTNVGGIQEVALRKRIEANMKRLEALPRGGVEQRQMMMDLARGSATFTSMVADAFKDRGGGGSAKRAQLQQFTQGNMLLADQLRDAIDKGEIQKQLVAGGKANVQQGKKQQKDAAKWQMTIDKMVKAGATATDQRYKTIAAIEKMRQDITAWLEKYWYVMLAMQALPALIRGLGALRTFGAGGRALGGAAGGVGRSAGGIGTAGRGIGRSRPSAQYRMAARRTGGWNTATRTGRLPASVAGNFGKRPGLLSRASGALRTGARGLATAGSVGLGALGVYHAFKGGYAIGSALDQYIGGKISNPDVRAAMGKDKTLSGAVGTLALGSRAKEFVRIRQNEYNLKRTQLKQLDQNIHSLRKYEASLSDAQRKQLYAMEEQRKQIYDSIKRREKLDKQSTKGYGLFRKELITQGLKGFKTKTTENATTAGGRLAREVLQRFGITKGEKVKELINQIQNAPEGSALRKRYKTPQERQQLIAGIQREHKAATIAKAMGGDTSIADVLKWSKERRDREFHRVRGVANTPTVAPAPGTGGGSGGRQNVNFSIVQPNAPTGAAQPEVDAHGAFTFRTSMPIQLKIDGNETANKLHNLQQQNAKNAGG